MSSVRSPPDLGRRAIGHAPSRSRQPFQRDPPSMPSTTSPRFHPALNPWLAHWGQAGGGHSLLCSPPRQPAPLSPATTCPRTAMSLPRLPPKYVSTRSDRSLHSISDTEP